MTNIPQRIGNYAIERRIGKGGMSEVWLAHHRSLENRQVAIKLLLSQTQEWVERFSREAILTSRLHHEYIVQIYDHGYQAPFFYTVMEYVPGGALRDVLKDHKQLPLDQALHIFRCAGTALDYAHSHGVIHRDVSPGNILIEQGSGRVLLTDFGIARETGKNNGTTVSKLMGTPGYLSPEHASSATAVTHLSDLYGLGVVFFEMLTGQLPWDHNPGMPPENNGGQFTTPMSLRDRGIQLPDELDRVIQTMLALDPTKRYPNAQAAIQDLERVLSRHTTTTQIVAAGADSPQPPDAAPAAVSPLAAPHPVETVLGLDLLKGPMQEARKRADALADPQEIARLLNTWSAQSRFRRPLLGRQAAIQRVTSANLYFYTLRVLYETRAPIKAIEEPDRTAVPVPMEKELDRWSLSLPAPKDFSDDPGGEVRVPGSTRVLACAVCSGIGKTTCPRCKGHGRIISVRESSTGASSRGANNQPPTNASHAATAVVATPHTRPAQVILPCPDCDGAGGLRCMRCDGVGRLLEKKVTIWSRQASIFEGVDDLPSIEEQWLARCKSMEVYRERQPGEFRAEWQYVPALKALLDQAETRTNENTKIALTELAITFVPITEIMFDLGGASPAHQVSQKLHPNATSGDDIYCWHIYGFERLLPNDWRFLNWDRVLALLAGAWVLALLVALLLLLTHEPVL